jgi:Polyketide cyclase / dehydrase and lipid transport
MIRMFVRWFPLAEAGDEFLDSAPFRYCHSVEVPLSPDQVWAELTADNTMASWNRLPIVTGIRWISPRPFGVDTMREVTVAHGALKIRERYFRWDEGKRKTFCGIETSLPLLRRFAEDYVVEPTPTGSRFTIVVAAEPRRQLTPLLRVADPATSLLVRNMAYSLHSRVRL